MLLSAAEYRRLKRRDRETLFVRELTDVDIEAILSLARPRAVVATSIPSAAI